MIVKDIDKFIEQYKYLKKSFKLRKSANYTELVTSTGNKIYYNKTKRFKDGLYLFGMVKKDISNYIEKNGQVTPYDELPVNYSNKEYDYSKPIIGIDINNAYWSVARLKGYITRKTYNKGIEKEGLKTIRLSSLSSLGKKRTYNVYEEGVYTHDEQTTGSDILQNVYLDIRYSTYGVMNEIAVELGEDFCCWKTDCIFFNDTDYNRELVTSMIESYGLTCKIEVSKNAITSN